MFFDLSRGGRRRLISFVCFRGKALMLDYESALTRRLTVPGFARKAGGDDKDGWYCTSA